jgi:hypothetical protein
MRVFQNSGIMSAYRPRLHALRRSDTTFRAMITTFLADRYCASHVLEPVLNGYASAFFTNGDDEVPQRAWAREQGMKANTPLSDILLAQIEAHRTEVFYNMDPVRYGRDFVARLPGSVRRRIAWRAAPTPRSDFSGYDLMVCNFPSILKGYEAAGFNTHYFFPAHDPVLDGYAANRDRPIDVLFVGGYSQYHERRAAVLDCVASLRERYRVVFALDRSRLARLAETPLGQLPILARYRVPRAVRAVSQAAVFGRDLYTLLSQAKIVLNGAVDMAGQDRGNMRCWEALGSGSLMVSDHGNYPAGMEDRQTMVLYDSPQDAARSIIASLEDPDSTQRIASAGFNMILERYSKSEQWSFFQRMAA